MANAYYGKQILAEISDAQTLPNGTSVDSTNMVYVDGSTNGGLMISVYANNDITIATGALFNIEVETYSADTAASARPPFTFTTSSPATKAFQANCHLYILHKTSADGELAFNAGDLMCQYVIPPDQMWTDTYIQLKYTTDGSEQTEKVDAFISAIV